MEKQDRTDINKDLSMAAVGDNSVPESLMTDTRTENAGTDFLSVDVLHLRSTEKRLGWCTVLSPSDEPNKNWYRRY